MKSSNNTNTTLLKIRSGPSWHTRHRKSQAPSFLGPVFPFLSHKFVPYFPQPRSSSQRARLVQLVLPNSFLESGTSHLFQTRTDACFIPVWHTVKFHDPPQNRPNVNNLTSLCVQATARSNVTESGVSPSPPSDVSLAKVISSIAVPV